MFHFSFFISHFSIISQSFFNHFSIIFLSNHYHLSCLVNVYYLLKNELFVLFIHFIFKVLILFFMNGLIKTNSKKCLKCKHFIVRAHLDWGVSYTCDRNWFAGCSAPSGYGVRLCTEAGSFEPIRDERQLSLFS